MSKNQDEITAIVRFEPYLVGLFAAAFIFKLMHLPFSGVAFVISASLLGIIYLFKAYDRMDHITEPWTQYFRKSILFLIAVGLVGLLFYFQNWPYSYQTRLAFLIGLPVFAIASFVKGVSLKNVLTVLEGMVILGLLLIITATFFNLL